MAVKAGIAGSPALQGLATITNPVMRAFAQEFPLATQAHPLSHRCFSGLNVLVLFFIGAVCAHGSPIPSLKPDRSWRK
jgi:hypothetical protein